VVGASHPDSCERGARARRAGNASRYCVLYRLRTRCSAARGMPQELIIQIAGTVVFASGRGRLDVAAVAQRTPPIRTAGIVLAGPLAKQGDYYLFDSTGFILVRPGTRTFSSFQIADDRFNYEGRRDGWPAWFPFKRTTVDTVGSGSPTASLRQRGAYPVYWHADIRGRELARGRFTVVDARPGELAVVRWFAATRALAALLMKGDTLDRAHPTVTALGLWAEQADTVPPTAIVEVRSFMNVRRADVSVDRLVLPTGYTEAPWPGYEKVQQVFPTSADSGAYWKRPPLRIGTRVDAASGKDSSVLGCRSVPRSGQLISLRNWLSEPASRLSTQCWFKRTWRGPTQ